MIIYEKGNLLSEKYKDFVIFHQCNCVTKDSKGLCKTLFVAFPIANDYIRSIKRTPGTTTFHKCDSNDTRVIANAYAQRYPGFSKYDNDSIKLRLMWFENCLLQLREYCVRENKTKIAFPEFIGCGLAGGDWDVYLALIQKFSVICPFLEIHVVSFSL